MKRTNWAIVIIIIIALGILASLLVARQKAQARFIKAAREADSLSFVAMALQEQIKAMVGIGEYKSDIILVPQDTAWLPQDTAWIPPDLIFVPEIVGTVGFDTTVDFKWSDWGFGIRAEGKFYCDSTHKNLNSLKIYPTYWKRPPPINDVLEIDTNLLQSFGFGIAAINTAVGLSGRYNRTTITIMRDLRKGGSWRLAGNVEFWKF